MTSLDLARTQRRTVATLAASQVLAGVGVATGIAVSSLIASELSGSDAVAGLTQTAAVVGAAAVALPLARLAARHGRRRSLTTGFVLAAVGAVGAAVATTLGSWPALVVAMVLFGAGSAAGLASRFAATDLATPERRATDLSVVVWATTIGSVLGPTLGGLADRVGAGAATSDHAGHGAAQAATGAGPTAAPYVLATVAFVAAALVVWVWLRPDPLHVAAEARTPAGTVPPPGPTAGGVRAGWAVVRSSGAARLALGAVVVSHLVMVGLMSMTPVHMNHGGATLQVVGLVISAHIAGMYALSPVIGWLADRVGHARVLVVGGVVLLGAAVVVAGAPSDDSARLTVGLVLLGIGWSCGLVAGSALLVDATPASSRTAVQGVSDLSMNAGGAVGGLLAGGVIALWSYATLAWGAAALVVAFLVVAVPAARRIGRLPGSVDVGRR
ncbi:MFS transporter [Cellulosimicrobium sp. PMB13]|uniref:MFS transporter n=1 Tax=Cellulosimicrobium sp. PMB13 TaxID=3120158 RepID=UPI003F4C2C02